MFRNTMPRYEVLSQDAMKILDGGWRRIVTDIGIVLRNIPGLSDELDAVTGLTS